MTERNKVVARNRISSGRTYNNLKAPFVVGARVFFV